MIAQPESLLNFRAIVRSATGYRVSTCDCDDQSLWLKMVV